jgi:prophage regulatory protein
MELDRLLTLPQVRQIVPYSAMHLWRLEKDGKFPRRIKVGPNRVAWSQSEISKWVEVRKAERRQA